MEKDRSLSRHFRYDTSLFLSVFTVLRVVPADSSMKYYYPVAVQLTVIKLCVDSFIHFIFVHFVGV